MLLQTASGILILGAAGANKRAAIIFLILQAADKVEMLLPLLMLLRIALGVLAQQPVGAWKPAAGRFLEQISLLANQILIT